MACTSSSMRTFFPTSTPPVSRLWFQVIPNSSRSISVEAANAARVSPRRPIPSPWYSTSSTTGRVTSRMVRSPTTLRVVSPVRSTRVLLNVMFGYSSTSKKSGLWRWLSRISIPVSMEVGSMVTSTHDSSGVGPTWICPPKRVKWPRTFDSIMYRATNPTPVWAGSISQVLWPGTSIPSSTAVVPDCSMACRSFPVLRVSPDSSVWLPPQPFTTQLYPQIVELSTVLLVPWGRGRADRSLGGRTPAHVGCAAAGAGRRGGRRGVGAAGQARAPGVLPGVHGGGGPALRRPPVPRGAERAPDAAGEGPAGPARGDVHHRRPRGRRDGASAGRLNGPTGLS